MGAFDRDMPKMGERYYGEQPNNKQTDIEKLDGFLINIANTKCGIRRKIITIEKYLESLKNQTHIDE